MEGVLTVEKYRSKIFSFICKISVMSEHHKCQNIKYIDITEIDQLKEIWMYVFKVYLILLPKQDRIKFLKNIKDIGLPLVSKNIEEWLENITPADKQRFM